MPPIFDLLAGKAVSMSRPQVADLKCKDLCWVPDLQCPVISIGGVDPKHLPHIDRVKLL